MNNFWMYLLVMAGVTYAVRVIPLVLVKKKIKNKFVVSFLHYVPYAVLSVMTVPAIFYATSSKISAAIGFAAACIASYFEQGLVKVAVISCAAVFIAEYAMKFI